MHFLLSLWELFTPLSMLEVSDLEDWLECDSTLVCKAFPHQELVLWCIKVRWRKCVKFCSGKEGNYCVDKLASLGLSSNEFKWYTAMLAFISLDFYHNRFLFPMYKAS